MRLFSLLFTFILAGVCLAGEQKSASVSQAKEPIYEGKTLSYWRALAKDGNPQTRSKAALALGTMGPTAIPALTELFKDTDGPVRFTAAWALGGVGPAAIPIAAKLLKDKDTGVRNLAASALLRVGPPAVPVLTGFSRGRGLSGS